MDLSERFESIARRAIEKAGAVDTDVEGYLEGLEQIHEAIEQAMDAAKQDIRAQSGDR